MLLVGWCHMVGGCEEANRHSKLVLQVDPIFCIKWAIAYAAIRIRGAFQHARFDLYDIDAIGDPVKLGYIVPQLEKEIEAPFPESHLQDAADEVTFYGVNSKSESFFVHISRGLNQRADAFIYLKLATGKTYSLTESVGYQQPSDGDCQIFSCGKLQIHYVCPMRRWRIFYCGMLKWKASSDVYDLTLDTNPQQIANAIARSDWTLPLVPPIQKYEKHFYVFYQQMTNNQFDIRKISASNRNQVSIPTKINDPPGAS
ncbi:hypothetical protein AVEN_124056-1 [Araneus ventricosus]|uniref:Uncharacterized protein n=1 Tax=Araneus ventricosus TaxID=182803 RepID=A0A4Y2HQD6_ARAVE|nr:hypothetical protein AVEN_124056-1 [Araneus ventricosus]